MPKRILTALVVTATLGLAACEVPEEPTDDKPSAAKIEKAHKKAKKENAEPAAPSMTLAEENALETAEGYIEMSGFSRKSLIEQLKYEGYANAEATFAAEAVGANWKREAAESAESYMDTSSFSAKSLGEQLAYEGYTDAQVAHGVSAAGY